MAGTEKHSENIGIYAPLSNTTRLNPSSGLLSLNSQRHTYGPAWSPAPDPPPCLCGEASSTHLREGNLCEEAEKQITLQDRYWDSSSADKGRDNNKTESQPVDACWAWVVLVAAFYIILFMENTTACFGILFSQKMFELEASSTNVSIIFTMHLIMRQCGIIITNSLVTQFGHRKVAFWSCFFGSASMMILAFSSSLPFVLINYSIIHGMNAGIGTTASFLIVPQYFEQRRGFALAVIMTGIAVGGMIFPMLVRSLQDEFGFFGGVLLLGAIISNCCVAASVFRPPQLEVKVEFSGKSPAISAWYIIAYSLANTGTRIIMTGLADRTWIKKRYVMASGALLAGLSGIAFVFVTEKLLTTTMLFFGVGIGLYWSLYHAHMIEVLGLELFKEAYGINSICMAAMFATTGPTIGVIRDWSGSYSWSIIPCACFLLLSAILLLPLPLAAARDKKLANPTDNNTVQTIVY